MSNCKHCDAGIKLIEPFWDGEPHHLVPEFEKREPQDLRPNFPHQIKMRCKNVRYNDDRNIGCPGCGGQRNHWGECK